MDRREWRERVALAVHTCGVIDCHHHTFGKAQRRQQAPGLFDFLKMCYLYLDLSSAGLPGGSIEALYKDGISECNDQEQWVTLRRYLPRVRNTASYRACMRAFRDLFGMKEDLNDHNWHEIDRRLRQANDDDDWFEEVLGRRMRLRCGLLDWHAGGTVIHSITSGQSTDWHDYILRVRPTVAEEEVGELTTQRKIDTRFFLPSVKIDALLHGYLPQCQKELEQLFGIKPGEFCSLAEYLEFIGLVFEQIKKDRAVAIKSALSGQRSLAYQRTAQSLAEVVFRQPVEELTVDDVVHFENFMMHHLVEKAEDAGLPIQFHTGGSPGGCNPDEKARPDLLLELIVAHPGARFDLMHCAYPFAGQLGNLAKRLPNVFINLAWMPLISAVQTRHILAGWLDMVPSNKIFWGGDCIYVEETYGAFLVARDAVADALADLIELDFLSAPVALELAQRIFYYNAIDFFSLEYHLSKTTVV